MLYVLSLAKDTRTPHHKVGCFVSSSKSLSLSLILTNVQRFLAAMDASHQSNVVTASGPLNASAFMPLVDNTSVDPTMLWKLFKPMFMHFYMSCRNCNNRMYHDHQKIVYDGEYTRFYHTSCQPCTKINLLIRDLYINYMTPKSDK